MTKYIDGYDFMDLLKDKKLVPVTDQIDATLTEKVAAIMSRLTGRINDSVVVADYDFMDLLQEKGYVPAGEPANDNIAVVNVAS
ncbi:hypothetical protein [Emcibacter nanhaiensis]|uniref:Uncharacterized protein n=1 Tax=Emcibacter nanhaiensis TaxID=1505037 RepID=A0A501PB35_9PROT|nr:hypothetical protein [Emcibacter nanhaiensis]TPD57609.1 hypothetical protein FIV46_15975 [Emcibacter nanhaiensis]